MQKQRIKKYNRYVVTEDFLLVSNYNSVMQLPLFLRAIINTTSKEYVTERKQSVNALAACLLLSGQKSVPTRAKRSIAGFKLREGALIGCRTTLREQKLYTVIDKLLTFALPRIYSDQENNLFFKTVNPLSLKKNTEISTSKVSLNNTAQYYRSHFTPTVRNIFLSDKKRYNINKGYIQGTKILSSCERTELSTILRFLKEDLNNNLIKNKEITSLQRIYHLALGIKNLLLMPELQEFLPLFESVRGINLGVSLSNPKIKGVSLMSSLFFSLQNFNLQSFISQLGVVERVLGYKISSANSNSSTRTRSSRVTASCNSNSNSNPNSNSNSNSTTYSAKLTSSNAHLHDLLKDINSDKENRSSRKSSRGVDTFLSYSTVDCKEIKNRVYLPFVRGSIIKTNGRNENGIKKLELQEIFSNLQDRSGSLPDENTKGFLPECKIYFPRRQSKERKYNSLLSYLIRGTSLLRVKRGILFLTCFQYPKQYN